MTCKISFDSYKVNYSYNVNYSLGEPNFDNLYIRSVQCVLILL